MSKDTKKTPSEVDQRQVKKKLKRAYCTERESIESEYTKRHEELEDWKRQKLDDSRTKYKQSIRQFATGEKEPFDDEPLPSLEQGDYRSGTAFYTYKPDQFQVQNGKTACTSISVVCGYHYLHRNLEPLDINWQQVVKTGAGIWAAWKEQTHSYKNLQLVHEILALEGMEAARKALEVLPEIAGSLDDNLVESYKRDCIDEDKFCNNTLQDVAKSIISHGCRIAAIFSVRGSSTTIMHDPSIDGKFWIFDSHGGIKYGESTLVECKSSEHLVSYLRSKYPVKRACSVNWRHHDTMHDENLFSVVVLRRKQDRS